MCSTMAGGVPVEDRLRRQYGSQYGDARGVQPVCRHAHQGQNWTYNASPGPLNRFAYTSPRTFRLTFGVGSRAVPFPFSFLLSFAVRL